MRRLGLGSAALAIVASLMIAGTSLGAALFQNGSFENGNYQGPTYGLDFDRLFVGDTDLTGWTITTGSIDWIKGYWQAAQGDYSLDLDGDEGTPGVISQTFDTIPYATYVVTFSMSGNPDAGPALKTMTVDAAGTSANFTYDTSVKANTRADMKYVSDGFSFVGGAVESSATLTFTSTTPGGYGPVLDNIVVTQTLPTGALCKNNGWRWLMDKEGTSFRNQGDCVSYFATGERNLAY